MDNYRVINARQGSFVVIPSRGGMTTVRDRAILSFAEKSLVQNLRCWHPGYETRKGSAVVNTSPYASGSTTNPWIYQFVKGKAYNGSYEKHLWLQFGAGLEECSITPPSTGATLVSGSTFVSTAPDLVPSFSNINDYMLYAAGSTQHLIYAGQDQAISAFIVYDGGSISYLPEVGEDYTTEVTDIDSSGTAILDSLGTLASNECISIQY